MGNDPSSAQKKETTHPVRLHQRLADGNYPLVENAIISLLLLHPELAPSVKIALQASEPELAESRAVVTLATLSLQQWWFFRVIFAPDHLPVFPEEPLLKHGTILSKIQLSTQSKENSPGL
ncbi:MAG TPA: hypothetical protein VGF67_12795 [Ktedonobacteraceae bacterium]